MFSAIGEDKLGLEARRHSPLCSNWSWSTPTQASLHIIHTVQLHDHIQEQDEHPTIDLTNPSHGLRIPHEVIIADDAILPILPSDLDIRYHNDGATLGKVMDEKDQPDAAATLATESMGTGPESAKMRPRKLSFAEAVLHDSTDGLEKERGALLLERLGYREDRNTAEIIWTR